MRPIIILSFLALFFIACGANSGTSNVNADSAQSISLSDTSSFSGLYKRILSSTQDIRIPAWIHTDSITGYKQIPVTVEQAKLLFPEDFELPFGATIYAFAQQHPDNTTTGIWYSMKSSPPAEEEGPETEDILLVLYTGDSVVTEAHYFATSGFGYALVDAQNKIREAFIDQMENVNVTTGITTIANGTFERTTEERSFGMGDTAVPASAAYLKEFFNTK